MSVPPHTLLPAPALFRFVAELTGLQLAVIPSPSPGRSWNLRRLVTECRGARRSNDRLDESRCRSCALGHLRQALAAPRRGHAIEESCGVRSFLLPVTGVAGPAGILTLRQGPPRGRRPANFVAAGDRHRDAAFRRAVRLLRAMALVSASSAEAGGPATRVAPAACGPVRAGEARSCRVVRALIERMRRDPAEPMDLKGMARESGLNASYLSTVFAREAGQPFKSYLTSLRIEHAQVLLDDPRLQVCEIARRAGYATPHRFRAAFRAWTGLSPSRWRALPHVEGESD